MRGKLRKLWIKWSDDDAQWVLVEHMGRKVWERIMKLSRGVDLSIWAARRFCRDQAWPDSPIRLQRFKKSGGIAKGFESSYYADSRRRKG